ncbi:type II secretion system F family protein [Clostridium sp. CCUG 7971]|uniref:type II secretion system F family protein n=1 Tax=Clostridium sp. CCUG 7971 TaxID=2811414 RepID=UPI001ABA645F|nr:type II secretion system F family protein [Clostridium sp. CCUG 7971]MBO3444684.1 type II secretion system F family protein [Clostridium sp. CCUG 7971]
MNLYKCIVYDKQKNRKSIKLEFESESQVNSYANLNELKIVSIKQAKFKNSNKKLKDREIKILCKEMSILLESGCEITKIFDILKSQSNKKIKTIFNRVTNHIQKGNSITESFQETNSFSNFFISMIKAGEISGNLDKVMNDLSDYYDKEHKLKSKIMLILIYPVILIILSIASMLFILFFIVPNFEIIFQNNGINPPILTKILINISRFIRVNHIFILIVFIISLFMINSYIKSSKFKNSVTFKIPIIKDISRLVITSKFCRSFSILIEGGIQIIDAINISSQVIDNEFIYERLAISREYIQRGDSISNSLSKPNIFPQLFISMINIGEESGRLDNSLKAINEFYENDLETKIQQFVKIIEPVITVIIGIVVGIFIISMVLPMFDAITSI